MEKFYPMRRDPDRNQRSAWRITDVAADESLMLAEQSSDSRHALITEKSQETTCSLASPISQWFLIPGPLPASCLITFALSFATLALPVAESKPLLTPRIRVTWQYQTALNWFIRRMMA